MRVIVGLVLMKLLGFRFGLRFSILEIFTVVSGVVPLFPSLDMASAICFMQ
jgi:hypothetical protein